MTYSGICNCLSPGTCYYLFPSQWPMKKLEDATDVGYICYILHKNNKRAFKFDL